LLKEALEVSRRLTRADAGDEVTVAELLPACLAWILFCSHKLLTLAVNNHSSVSMDADLLAPGGLTRNGHVEQSRFSVARLVF
jgi:hypothetical protein